MEPVAQPWSWARVGGQVVGGPAVAGDEGRGLQELVESRPGSTGGMGPPGIAAWGQPEEGSCGAGRVGGPSRCGGLTVREVSFGGVWPSSRVRYAEGGHSGRFRLGRLGLVQSRRDDDRGDGPFGDGRQDAGPGFRPVDVVMVRGRVRRRPSRRGPAARGSPGPVGGRGPT